MEIGKLEGFRVDRGFRLPEYSSLMNAPVTLLANCISYAFLRLYTPFHAFVSV